MRVKQDDQSICRTDKERLFNGNSRQGLAEEDYCRCTWKTGGKRKERSNNCIPERKQYTTKAQQ
jgi:hypothetical protein